MASSRRARTKAKAVGQMTRGEKVCEFIERFCIVPEGAKVGQPIKLDHFQRKFILAIYDNPHLTSRAYLSLARKNGKTALIACILLAHLVGPEAVLNSQIISGARSREQAALVYSLASKMVSLSPVLRDLVKPIPSSKILVGLPLNVEYKAIAAEGTTAHGLSPIVAILDEVGQVRGPRDDFIDAITTAQGAYENPLLIAISTQAATDADMFSIWLDDAERSGDPHIVSHVYSAPKDCDLLDEKAWEAANPALGNFRNKGDVLRQATQAKRMPSVENTFRNLTLNQRISMFAPFVSLDVWKANGRAVDYSVFDEHTCYIGVDLSARTDLTAAVIIAQDDDGVWHTLPIFWTPEDGLLERSTRDRVPYDVWVAQGYLRTTPGKTVDYEFVAQELAEMMENREVGLLSFDRWRFDLLKKHFTELGIDWQMAPFGQGFKDMSPALDNIESDLLNGLFAHEMNPVLTMCASNATVIKDAAGNRKLDKSKSTGRIDGMIALVMAHGAAKSVVSDETAPGMATL